jgi:PAS domain S-box-containing protein
MSETVNTNSGKDYSLTKPSLFFLVLLAAFVLIFGVACLVGYNSYGNAVHSTIRQNETRAELLGKIVLEHHRAALGIVQSYASRPLLVNSVRKKDFEGALLHLTNLSKENPEVATSWISNPDSTAWANFPVDTNGYGKDLSHRDWYKGVSKEWKPYVSDIYKLITQQKGLAVSLCVPIHDEKEKVIGILGASLATGFYHDLVRHISFDMDAAITLVDREGHIIFSDSYPDDKEVRPYPLFGAVKGAMRKASSTIEVRDTSDHSRVKYVSLAPVEEIGWSVIIEKPRSSVFYSAFGDIIQIGVISFLTFVVAVFLIVYLRRRRRLLDAVQEEKDRLSALINSIQDEVWFADAHKKFTMVNPLALQEFSLENGLMTDIEELAGSLEVYRPDGTIRPVDEAPPLRALQGEAVRSQEEIIRTPGSGQLRYREVSAFPVRQPGGSIIGSVSIVRDITQRKQTELALQASEERWATTLASIGDAVIATDTSGNIMFMNVVAEALTGWTLDEAAAKPVTTVFHIINENTRKEVDNPVAKVLRDGMIVGLANHTLLVKKDGMEVPIDDSGAPIRDKEGKTAGVVLVFRDITERKRAEEVLNNAYEALKRETNERQRTEETLRQAQKMDALGTLSGGIAHDFNNILAAIIGFSELLASHVIKGSRDERHLGRIMEASLRGRELVRQMLTFSRKTEQEKKPLRLSSIVAETARLIRSTTPTTIDIKVNTQTESGMILGDPTQIQQVLLNLCMNAVYAMRDKGGVLDIELSDFSVSSSSGNPQGIDPGQYMKLAVRDIGTGMSPDIMDKIFDPFFTTKKLGEGTGLGLSVVHGIIRQSDGYITVESEPGKGSTFIVYFPKISGVVEAEHHQESIIPTGTERVLFVDDEELLVEMGEEILAELGYEVTSLTSSKEALSLLKEDPSRFDLVITDQTMPDMTGIELAQEILIIRPDMPIVMCTGFSHIVDADKAKSAGIKAFAMKPLTKREIARTVRQVLDT